MMLPRRTERMTDISELTRAQNFTSLEHKLRPVRQRLRTVRQEEPRHAEQVGVAEQASERVALLGEQTRGTVPVASSHEVGVVEGPAGRSASRRTPRAGTKSDSRSAPCPAAIQSLGARASHPRPRTPAVRTARRSHPTVARAPRRAASWPPRAAAASHRSVRRRSRWRHARLRTAYGTRSLHWRVLAASSHSRRERSWAPAGRRTPR
jgi:hypothetical protein